MWCKYEVKNIKTGHTGIYTVSWSLEPNQRQWVVERLPDTLYEYGKILDLTLGQSSLMVVFKRIPSVENVCMNMT